MYQGNRPQQGRPSSGRSPQNRPQHNNRNPQRKRRPFPKPQPTGPTRAQVRNERNKRIEYHMINILRVAMKEEKFNELMNMAKRRADTEIARLAKAGSAEPQTAGTRLA